MNSSRMTDLNKTVCSRFKNPIDDDAAKFGKFTQDKLSPR